MTVYEHNHVRDNEAWRERLPFNSVDEGYHLATNLDGRDYAQAQSSYSSGCVVGLAAETTGQREPWCLVQRTHLGDLLALSTNANLTLAACNNGLVAITRRALGENEPLTVGPWDWSELRRLETAKTMRMTPNTFMTPRPIPPECAAFMRAPT